MRMNPLYMVQKYVGIIRRRNYLYMVFETGDPKYYLFCTATHGTLIQTGLSFPVRKSELRREVSSALKQRGFYDASEKY